MVVSTGSYGKVEINEGFHTPQFQSPGTSLVLLTKMLLILVLGVETKLKLFVQETEKEWLQCCMPMVHLKTFARNGGLNWRG